MHSKIVKFARTIAILILYRAGILISITFECGEITGVITTVITEQFPFFRPVWLAVHWGNRTSPCTIFFKLGGLVERLEIRSTHLGQ